jgi:HPr kinase/phosphorylase
MGGESHRPGIANSARTKKENTGSLKGRPVYHPIARGARLKSLGFIGMETQKGGGVLVHGTCIALGGRAVLLRGAPGSGKSDLALRFISTFGSVSGSDAPRASLVADDQVLLTREGDIIQARAPASIAGRMEVRGIGIVDVAHERATSLVLIVDLVTARDMPRLPPDPLPCEDVRGVRLPVLKLDPFEISAPVKLKLALTGSLENLS